MSEETRKIESVHIADSNHFSDETSIIVKNSQNVLLNCDVKVGGSLQIGNNTVNYYNTSEPFTPPVLPPRPPDHLPRRIFQEKDAGNVGPFSSRESYDLLAELEKKPKIALLGDAGMGKSTELEWVCHELKDNKNGVPVYIRLRNYNENERAILESFNPDAKAIEKIILVLDGFDEIDRAVGKRVIDAISEKYPNLRVLVSSRISAYNDTLDYFQTYTLAPLSQAQVLNYLEAKLGGEGESVFKKLGWERASLLQNPFFLVNTCEFCKKHGNKLPEPLWNLFEYLVEVSLDARLKSISYTGKGNKEVLRRNCKASLERLAFLMETQKLNEISENRFCELIKEEKEREVLMEGSSLVSISGGNWCFMHNFFKEFFAAKALKKAKDLNTVKAVIAYEPDFNHLKWSWVSVSFLLSLLEEKPYLKTELVEWLSKANPEALIKIGSFEKTSVSLNDREKVFKQIFDSCKKQDLIIGSHHYSYWDLAAFGESLDTVHYLMEELRSAKTPIVKNNALDLLKAMKGHYVFGEKKATLKNLLLQNIHDFEDNTPGNRHNAMEALLQLEGGLREEEAVKMVEMFFDSNYGLERSSAYKIIEKQKLQVQYMERLIRRIRDLRDHDWKKQHSDSSRDEWDIENCFKEANNEEVLVSFFEKYPVSVENKWDDNLKPLNLMLEKLDGMTLSKQGVERVFQAMKSRFSDWMAHPTEAKRDVIMNFIEKNGLRHAFFKSIIDEGEIWAPWVSTTFMDEEGIEYVVDKFKREELDREWLTKYQWWVGRQDMVLLSKLNQRLNEVAGEPFPLPEFKPPIDYEQRRKDKLLEEKSLYFSKEKYIHELEDIFIFFEKESFNKHEIYDVKAEKAKENRDEDVYDRYPNMLIWMIDDHPGMHKDELKKLVAERWEWISISSIQKFIETHQQEIEKDPNLDLDKEEKAYIKNWCDAQRTKIDWNGQFYESDVLFAWFVTHFHFTHYPADTYLQIVGSGLQNHGVRANVLEFVEQHKPELLSKLKGRVLENIATRKAQGYELHLHLDFVKNHQMTEAIYDMQPYIEETGGYAYEALRVCISLNGGDNDYLLDLLTRITPTPEDYREGTLLDHFSAKQNKAFEKILLQKLAATADLELQLTYARYLVREGNLVGLQFLADYIEREKKSPFSAHIGNRDVLFENPMGIPLLLRFYDYGCDPSIPQDNFNSLLSIGRNMLLHLASCQDRRHFELVRNAVIEHLEAHIILNEVTEPQNHSLQIANPEAIKRLRYLLKDLDFNHYQKQPIGLPEAENTWKELS